MCVWCMCLSFTHWIQYLSTDYLGEGLNTTCWWDQAGCPPEGKNWRLNAAALWAWWPFKCISNRCTDFYKKCNFVQSLRKLDCRTSTIHPRINCGKQIAMNGKSIVTWKHVGVCVDDGWFKQPHLTQSDWSLVCWWAVTPGSCAWWGGITLTAASVPCGRNFPCGWSLPCERSLPCGRAGEAGV